MYLWQFKITSKFTPRENRINDDKDQYSLFKEALNECHMQINFLSLLSEIWFSQKMILMSKLLKNKLLPLHDRKTDRLGFLGWRFLACAKDWQLGGLFFLLSMDVHLHSLDAIPDLRLTTRLNFGDDYRNIWTNILWLSFGADVNFVSAYEPIFILQIKKEVQKTNQNDSAISSCHSL